MSIQKIFIGVFVGVCLSPVLSFAQVKALILEELIREIKPMLRNQSQFVGYAKPDFENILGFIMSDVETGLLGRQDVAESLLNTISRERGHSYWYSRYKSLSDLLNQFEQYKKTSRSWGTLESFIKQKICVDGNDSALVGFLNHKDNQGVWTQRILQSQNATELRQVLSDPKNASYRAEFDRLVNKLKLSYLEDYKLLMMEAYKTSVAEVLQNFVYIVNLRATEDKSNTFIWYYFEEEANLPKYKGQAKVKDYVDDELLALVNKSSFNKKMQLAMEGVAQRYAEPIESLQKYRHFYIKYRPKISNEDEVLGFLKRLTRFLR